MAIVLSEIEGPVVGKPNLVGANVNMKVVGVNVTVPRLTQDPDFPGDPTRQMLTPIITPKGLLPLAQLANPAKFNGRTQDGFDGAVAIVKGNYDTDTNLLTATSVEIQPAENLLLGALTSINPLMINGVPVLLIQDPRMKFEGFTNEFGFLVQLGPELLNTMATAEGYYVGGNFYAHKVEVDATAKMVPNQPSVSVTRARTRSRAGGPATVDIRGGVDFNAFPTLAGTFSLQIRRVERDPITLVENQPDILIGIEQATRDAAFPRFGLWRLKGPLTQPPAGQLLGEPFPLTAPRMVRVQPAIPGVTPPQGGKAEKEADVRF